MRKRYYIIEIQPHQGSRYTWGYESVKALKNKTISRLDGKGWEDKYHVDLRSVNSMADYLHDGQWIKITRTSSLDKLQECDYVK